MWRTCASTTASSSASAPTPAASAVAVRDDPGLFDVARRLVRRHHEWLVLHDYLERLTMPGTVTRTARRRAARYRPLPDGELWMPLEFAAAAFRFGHSDDPRLLRPQPQPRTRRLTKSATTTELLFQYTGTRRATPGRRTRR